MAFHYSPKIVTDGLILYLDAANSKSFSTASNTWFDISKSEYNGTLFNGATYSTLNGGCIVFDGLDDAVSIPNVDTMLSSTGLGTIDFVYKINSVPGSDFRNIWGFSNSIFQYENNGGFMLFVWRYDDLTTYEGVSSGIVNTDLNLYHITCTYIVTGGSATFKIYKNGLLVNSKTVNLTSISKVLIPTSKSPLLLGNNTSTSQNCSIFNFKIYNRELSASEVFQNFNATKTRFGL